MDWQYQLDKLFETVSKEEVVLFISSHPEEIPNMIKIIKQSSEKSAWRAAWIIDLIYRDKPSLIKPYIKELLNILLETPYNGVRRSLLKIIHSEPPSTTEDGRLLDKCFQWIVSPTIPTAVRVHAMHYISQLLPSYPELKNEFILCLETALNDENKGIKTKARNLLKQIEQVGVP